MQALTFQTLKVSNQRALYGDTDQCSTPLDTCHVKGATAETPGLCLILFTWSETLPLNVQAWMSSSNQFDCKSMKKLTNNRAAHNDKIF